MPNVLAHINAAHAILYAPSPDEVLGNVLPDFRGMYLDSTKDRVDVEIDSLSVALDRGIQLHKRIDRIFNLQSETLEMTTSLTKDFMKAGIKPQAARMGAHMLADVMPDGALLRDSQTVEEYQILREYVLDEETALHDGYFPPEFTEYVCKFFDRDVVKSYRDPERLAAIVQHRLENRARKPKDKRTRTIPLAQIPALAEVIDLRTNRIHHLGTAALTRTIEIAEASYDF